MQSWQWEEKKKKNTECINRPDFLARGDVNSVNASSAKQMSLRPACICVKKHSNKSDDIIHTSRHAVLTDYNFVMFAATQYLCCHIVQAYIFAKKKKKVTSGSNNSSMFIHIKNLGFKMEISRMR